MITILHGSNQLAIDERVAEMRASADPSGINTSRFDNVSQPLAELRAASGSPGFFGTTRVVVAHRLLGPAAGGKGRRAGAKGALADTLEVLASVPETTHLIIVEESLDPPLEREIRKAAPGVAIERHDVPRGRDLVNWVSERARRHGATLPSDVATRLLEALFPGTWRAAAPRDDLPPSLYRLDAEIAKLAVAAAGEGRITVEHVTALVPEAEADNLWGLTDAIAAGDPRRAVRELEISLGHGTPPELLLAQLAAQFEALAALAALDGSGDLARAAAVTGLTEGRLRQAARASRRFPPGRVRLALDLLRDIDRDAKLGRAQPADALAAAVARLAAAQSASP